MDVLNAGLTVTSTSLFDHDFVFYDPKNEFPPPYPLAPNNASPPEANTPPLFDHNKPNETKHNKRNKDFAAADSNSSAKSFVPCKVCGDKASGYHYGVTSCEGCKGFFRRSIQKQIEYRCLRDGKCLVIRLNRNRCQYCRFKKCLAVGMSRDSVRYGRVPKRSRTEERVTSAEADQSEQLAMYDIILTISHAHHANCAYTEEKTRGITRKPITCSEVRASPESPDSSEHAKLVLWTQFAACVTPSIQRIVEFAKRVPSFLDLSQDDQLILIKLGFFECWVVHVARMLNTCDNTLTFACGTFITRQQLELIFDHEFVAALLSFMVTLNNLSLNDTEVGLFTAVVLLQHERAGIYDEKAIQQNFDKMSEALKLQIQRNHAQEPHVFEQLMLKVGEVRALGQKHAQHLSWFRAQWTRLKLPPLFAEIFDIPKHEEC